LDGTRTSGEGFPRISLIFSSFNNFIWSFRHTTSSTRIKAVFPECGLFSEICPADANRLLLDAGPEIGRGFLNKKEAVQ